MRTSIKKIAEERLVEKLVADIGKSETRWNLDDLVQDIYLDLLMKKDRIEQIDDSQIRFYLARMIINNIHSKTSRYYVTYKKNEHEEIEGYNERLQSE